ncbi:MAG: hypothetical protein ABF289_16780 [Clostridiales bacterium]
MKKYKVKKMLDEYVSKDKNDGVQYLTSSELEIYKIHIKDGLLYNFKGNLLDTSRGWTLHNLQSAGIYVMDEFGNLFVSISHTEKFHHSSFLSGKPVAGAGEIIIEKGKLIFINNKSGHYTPNCLYLTQVRSRFKKELSYKFKTKSF